MIRTPIGTEEYWEKWTEYSANRAVKMLASLDGPSPNPIYDPQYLFDAAITFQREGLNKAEIRELC